jgi:hypothetical protein
LGGIAELRNCRIAELPNCRITELPNKVHHITGAIPALRAFV